MSFPVQGYFDPRSVPFFVREPTSQQCAFQGNNVAPHGATLRATYTTPAGKLAKIGFITSFVFRRQNGTGDGNAEVDIDSSIRGRFVKMNFRSPTLGDSQRSNSVGDFLESGEAITITTEDDSTGSLSNSLLEYLNCFLIFPFPNFPLAFTKVGGTSIFQTVGDISSTKL